jgi:hypothetical protein
MRLHLKFRSTVVYLMFIAIFMKYYIEKLFQALVMSKFISLSSTEPPELSEIVRIKMKIKKFMNFISTNFFT